MEKLDYRTLEKGDLLSLSDKITKALEELCDKGNEERAYETVSSEVERIREKEAHSDKSGRSFVALSEISKEVKHRLYEGRGPVGREIVNSKEQRSLKDGEKRYFLRFKVEGDVFSYGFTENGKGLDVLFANSCIRTDGKKEIPDEELLKHSPLEWFAKYVKSDVYKIDEGDYDEDYDEGFDELDNK